jgi:hypothetical protein
MFQNQAWKMHAGEQISSSTSQPNRRIISLIQMFGDAFYQPGCLEDHTARTWSTASAIIPFRSNTLLPVGAARANDPAETFHPLA